MTTAIAIAIAIHFFVTGVINRLNDAEVVRVGISRSSVFGQITAVPVTCHVIFERNRCRSELFEPVFFKPRKHRSGFAGIWFSMLYTLSMLVVYLRFVFAMGLLLLFCWLSTMPFVLL